MSDFENHFKKETILEKTKNSVNNLINYNNNFKNNIQYPGEPLDELKIKQLLLPVYDKIYQIKEDLLLFSELNSQNSSKNITARKFNEMQHLHTNILFNKNIIDDTLNYMKEKIENVNYEQINNEFREIEITLENLKNEMEEMIEDFNNKYDKIIKEKKRQKIADDIMKGNYNKVPDDYNKGLNISTKLKNKLDNSGENGMDYDKYKYDIDEIDREKENLMLKYLEEKQKAINGLPQMVPPHQKVNFNYDDIKAPNFKNLNNNNNNNNKYINNNSNSEINNKSNNIDSNNLNNENNNINKNAVDNIIKDIDYNENNINNNNNNQNDINESNLNNNIDNNKNSEISNKNINNNNNNISQINNNKINNKKDDINNNISSSNNNNNIPKNYYMNQDYNNEENGLNEKNNVDPTETLNNFKEKMSAASKAILTGPAMINKQGPKSKKYIDPNKEAYDAYMRNIQPRSSGSKVAIQDFNKMKKPRPKRIKKEIKKKPNRYDIGKYPDENEKSRINEFLEKNPSRPVNKNLRILEKEDLEEEIKRIVDIHIKKAINIYQFNKGNIDSSRIKKNNSEGNNEELLKLLIQKFDDIESAIRETNNKGNGIEFNQDINEILANEIFNKIYSQINSKINIKQKKEESEEEEEEEEESEKKIVPKKKDFDNKIIEEPKNINIFNENINTDLKDLDEVIPAPRELNLNKYDDISITSENLTQSIKQKPDLNMNPNKQIEITNINIKKNQFLMNNNQIDYNNYLNKKNKIDYSLSEGEVHSNLEQSSQSDYNQNNKYYTANNFMPNFINKNKTGNDLLMLKYYNENLPEVNFNNNINNNFNNEEDINLNNDNLLKQMDIYDSGEYNEFKNKFKENMNNNKTLNNFESMPNNQNIIDEDIQNLKIIKHDKKENDEIQHKIELLKLKNEQDSEENNNNNIDSNNYINNNFNIPINNINNIINKNDDGNSSPGEVRSEDSY